MSGIDFNALLGEADKSGSGAPVPEGEYDVVVQTAEAGTTQNGKTKFNVRFKVLTGPHAGRAVFNNFIISPESAGALAFFFRHMDVLGLNRDYFAGNPAPAAVATALVGRQAKITVAHREWNGKPQADVKDVKPATPGIIAQATTVSGVPAAAPAAPVAAPAPAPAAPAPVAPVAAPAPAPGVPNPGF